MGIKAWMPWVFGKKLQSLGHGCKNGSFALSRPKVAKLVLSFFGKEYFEDHLRVIYLREVEFNNTAGFDVFDAALDRRQAFWIFVDPGLVIGY
jgi:hypothetical protein